ncbi:hypothetical protein DA01_04405 [Dehalococcoides mccartyi]|uniref:Uncharacterized protein n=1 Tax=Dehalococcoides mccartyi TaxID=61435 RepID=A0A0V8M307_9CHLR|nr:hypothetical protein [Dehalococcoides mccartyi]KSV18122.1 hypothetical protein DA01_04405 [Dehalococcoides mccartyi]
MSKDIKYGTIDLMYCGIESHYEVMERRFEAINTRISNLIAWVIGSTSALLIFGSTCTDDKSSNMQWIILGACMFIISIIFGIIAYNSGGIQRINPKSLYKDYLNYSEYEYKEYMIRWAGKHFETTKKSIDRKNCLIKAMAGSWILEILLLGLWVILP